MRVTTSSIYDQARRNVGSGQADAARIREQISSGRRVTSFGDDPVAANRVVRDTTTLSDVRAHRGSLDRAEHLLGVAENELSAAGDIINRVRELTTQMSSDTYNTQDRITAANEIVQLREQLVDVANTRVDDRYIFGGLGNAGPPFDAAGVFSGDAGSLTLAVTRTSTMNATLPGGEPFVDPAGGNTIFDTLDAIEVALRADDGPGLSVLIDEVVVQHDRLTTSQQTLGGLFDRIENVRGALDRTELATEQSLSNARDTDVVSAIVELQKTEQSLQAALAVTARIDGLSLLNYL